MSDLPKPRPEILGLRPYVQGKSRLEGSLKPVKLSSNESPYGPSPKALQAYCDARGTLHRYPDGAQIELRRAIAETHGLGERQILCGNGSEEIIGLLIRAYVNAGEELLLSENHFMMCPIYARTQGAEVVVAPERDFVVCVDALLARVTPQTRMVVVANPNNPTGTYLPIHEIRRLHAKLPPRVLLLLDGAYAEYVMQEDYEAGASLVNAHGNVVMTRTFSKAYGLAGLRIGWAHCPPHVIDVLQRIRTPFNTNQAALTAAAAAVRDRGFIEDVRQRNHHELQLILVQLRRLGLRVVPSVTNFYRVDFADLPGRGAVAATAFLEARGIIPRPLRSDNRDNALRLTVGTAQENEIALDALRAYLES
jgi:histidinol-phosphate aminotransferase